MEHKLQEKRVMAKNSVSERDLLPYQSRQESFQHSNYSQLSLNFIASQQLSLWLKSQNISLAFTTYRVFWLISAYLFVSFLSKTHVN